MKEAIQALWQSYSGVTKKAGIVFLAVIIIFVAGYYSGYRRGSRTGFVKGHESGLEDCPVTTTIPPSLHDSIDQKRGRK